jgi:uncharacterized protein YbcI
MKLIAAENLLLMRCVNSLHEAVASVQRMIADGKRARDIVHRIRALVRKSDEERTRLDLNEVIGDVVVLIQCEVSNHRVALHVERAPGCRPCSAMESSCSR